MAMGNDQHLLNHGLGVCRYAARILALAVSLLMGAPEAGKISPSLAHAAPVAASYDCTANLDLPMVECEALVALYNSTNGPGWIDRSGWLAGLHPCEWHRVFCATGHVTQVHLQNNRLTGSIPAQVASLAHLQLLDLSGNQLVGSIPKQLGNLSSLEYLLLGNNRLTGSIPPELGGLGSLRYLWLHTNQLTGSIPPELGRLANLQYLLLTSNRLTGSVPNQLGDLTNLLALTLDHNPSLVGSLPDRLAQLTPGTFLFNETGLCEPAIMTFQNWLASIPHLGRTNVLCVTGGKNLSISASPPTLSWDAGTGQTSYTLLKYNTATATPTLVNLPGNATSYADASAPSGTVYCYALAPLEPSGAVLGLSDVVCGATGMATGSVLPQGFVLKLGGTTNATMAWTAPAGGADGYLLQRIPLDGTSITNVTLPGGTTTTTQAVVTSGTCFHLVASKGAAYGTSEVLCGLPGISTLGNQPTGKRLQSVSDALTEVTGRLQAAVRPPAQATPDNR